MFGDQLCKHLRVAAMLRHLIAVSVVLASLAGVSLGPAQAQDKITVFAAASMTDAISEIAELYQETTNTKVVLVFAGSGTLARQVESGAPADIFISADEAWMTYAQDRGAIQPETVRFIAANQLVLVGPASSATQVDLKVDSILDKIGPLRLAMADPDTVPAGRYGKQALEGLGLWQPLARKLAPMENVRVALAAVARGDTPLGIVYASDAAVEPRVRVVAVFPPTSHASIRYPAAVTTHASTQAMAFLQFLSDKNAQTILRAKGFTSLP
ncbi:MAG: molybdate ABC transporter substrate-binding protein [Rhodobacteraceae bacterium]|nr:molybdate ABC transporter substrate-binding protein [Paracoccaceae bacterium]